MRSVCSLHNIAFPILVEKQEPKQGEVLAALKNFMLADQKYNIRYVRDDENFRYDILSSPRMEVMS